MSEKTNTPKGYSSARQKAEKLLKDKSRLEKLLDDADAKAEHSKKKISSYWSELQGLLRLVKAWMIGEYRQIPWKSVVMAVAAIVYFVNPFDVIPDFLLGWGYIDDLTVIGFVMNSMRGEVLKFLDWETRKEEDQSNAAPKTPAESPN